MAEPNNFPIAGLLLIIVALTALGYLLLAYSINIWPFASKPTCDNIDGNGKSFTCTSGPVKKGVTCATSTCTDKECCTDPNTPTPPPPPPPTPCPYCGKSLATAKARLCLHCGEDWYHLQPGQFPSFEK